jgi:hypothetical protein
VFPQRYLPPPPPPPPRGCLAKVDVARDNNIPQRRRKNNAMLLS